MYLSGMAEATNFTFGVQIDYMEFYPNNAKLDQTCPNQDFNVRMPSLFVEKLQLEDSNFLCRLSYGVLTNKM